MAKVWQEFYCTKSGGGCGKYFMIRLNMGIDYVVTIVCPNCKHEHSRNIEKGVIKENGRFDSKSREEIYPPKSSVTDEPRTKALKNGGSQTQNERDGAVVESADDFVQDSILRQSWLDRFGSRVFGRQKEKS